MGYLNFVYAYCDYLSDSDADIITVIAVEEYYGVSFEFAEDYL